MKIDDTMQVLRLTDESLAKVFTLVRTEVRRRAKNSMKDDLALIRGQEMGKRALIVAVAGNHSILFIGPPNCGKSMLRAAAVKLGDIVTFEARPCPCGYYGSARHECRCKPAAIEKTIAAWPRVDICIEVPEVPERELRNQMLGTGMAEVLQYTKNATHFTDLSIDGDCANLLRAAAAELGLDADQRERIIQVARTIANLSCSEPILPYHLNEAINYRMQRPYGFR